MLQPKLHKDHNVRVDDVVLACGPSSDPVPTAGLIGVAARGIELVVAVARDVEIVVRELGALEVEGVLVGEDLLKGRGVDPVADWFPVDGVSDGGVLDLEGAVEVIVEVQTRRLGHGGFLRVVADAVGVEGRAGHGVDFVVDEAVGVAVDHGVDAEGEDVLVVRG